MEYLKKEEKTYTPNPTPEEKNNQKYEDDDMICRICEINKANVLLECYVSIY